MDLVIHPRCLRVRACRTALRRTAQRAEPGPRFATGESQSVAGTSAADGLHQWSPRFHRSRRWRPSTGLRRGVTARPAGVAQPRRPSTDNRLPTSRTRAASASDRRQDLVVVQRHDCRHDETLRQNEPFCRSVHHVAAHQLGEHPRPLECFRASIRRRPITTSWVGLLGPDPTIGSGRSATPPRRRPARRSPRR